MAFDSVRNRVRSRFNEVQLYLNYLTSLEPDEINEPHGLELKIQRGLFYVHLYAALEKSINDVVETTLILISSKSVKGVHYSQQFSSVAFYDKLKSFKDSSYTKFLIKSSDIFEEARSSRVTKINDSAFSSILQNVWSRTLEEIYICFGMKNLNVTAQERATIDEIVDKRNAVAHGRESAAVVGERHRCNILREKHNILSEVVIRIVDDMEYFYLSKSYIKPSAKKNYS